MATVVAAIGLAACGDGPEDFGSLAVSGNAFALARACLTIPDAQVTLVVDGRRVGRTRTGGDGFFQFEGLRAGEEVYLEMTHPDFHISQTATFTMGEADLERVTFQAVAWFLWGLFERQVGATADPARCQISTTVTRVGKSLYDCQTHGLAGATVSIEPLLPPEHGPIYFSAITFPDLNLTETTEDGGVVFINVPPGRYTLQAHKAGARFGPVVADARAGLLVNASPPWGIQEIE